MSYELLDKIKGLLLNKPLLAALATVRPDGRPWTRYVVITTDDDMSIHFATYADSRKIDDIIHNPEVHLTAGDESLEAMGPFLQIEGRARFSQEEHIRHQYWSEDFAPYFDGPDDPNYGIVTVTPYRIEYWEAAQRHPEVLELVTA